MKRLVALGIVGLALVAAPARTALADAVTGTPGQPNQSCQAVFGVPNPPYGSPAGFNTAGFANAGNVYAGSGNAAAVSGNPNAQSNPNAVSQYDVACYQTASH
jgi:hypothetical protein